MREYDFIQPIHIAEELYTLPVESKRLVKTAIQRFDYSKPDERKIRIPFSEVWRNGQNCRNMNSKQKEKLVSILREARSFGVDIKTKSFDYELNFFRCISFQNDVLEMTFTQGAAAILTAYRISGYQEEELKKLESKKLLWFIKKVEKHIKKQLAKIIEKNRNYF